MKKFAFIFAGQGSQSVGMGKDFYENFSSAKLLLNDACNDTGIDFEELLFTQNDKLDKTEFTQPAIVLNSLMSYLAFSEHIKAKPEFSLGHSLGEFTALAVSGAFSFVEAIRLVNLRGKFMQEACVGKDAGMMVVLGLSDEVVEGICKNAQNEGLQIYAANYNCDGQIVVAGVRADLAKYEAKFKEAGAKRAMLLNMSVASHCPILEPASVKLANELEGVLAENFAPVVSNVNAKIYTDKKEALVLLKEQLTHPVHYKQSIKNYENEVDCFIELGAATLKGINKKITERPTYSVTDMASLEEVVKILEER
ncbi:ACP S-malonyltransferase [Campylobacter concisus]|uniref:ACP S-malonyltransferase n=2 Tax=Campylobacter concisus TaxID=199 RepID=UPI000CD80DAB|nr:ACP S-malonyltransferase [Campylobacter concisus]MBE9835514.1 ACP S-malonyltransferase [Campylobacter concisus]MBE9855996.1 ACP S-malonyltransferase [Campylobacter concisus]